jgi:VWFA-related protein
VRSVVGVVGLAALGLAGPQQQQSPPQFRGEVDLVRIEAQVVDKDGAPMATLTKDDFEVSLNYKPRRVVSADFIRYDGKPAPSPAGKPTDRESAAKAMEGRRVFVLAIDESSFRPQGAQAAVTAARRFIEHLQPTDIIGVFRFPMSDPSITLATDHSEGLKALAQVVGTLTVPSTEFHLSASEVVDIASRGSAATPALQRVVRRECPTDVTCGRRIQAEAMSLAVYAETSVAQSLAGLRSLLDSMAGIPTRKTLVVVSGGLMAGDGAGARPNIGAMTSMVGEQAARSNVNLYVMHLDSSFDDMFSADRGRNRSSVLRDDMLLGLALEHFAGAAGGALFRIRGGLTDFAFDRVLRETSAYYLLGVAPEESDRDGRIHYVQVKTKAKGAEVRARAQVVIPKS